MRRLEAIDPAEGGGHADGAGAIAAHAQTLTMRVHDHCVSQRDGMFITPPEQSALP